MRKHPIAGLIAAALCIMPLHAIAATEAPKTTAANPAAAPAVQPVDLTGFRSAQFGMDEAAVRAAIKADFGKDIADRIQEQENAAEKTKLFNVLVPDLFEGAGTGSVSYVFGYKSKKLIQVVLLWSAQTDTALNPDRLLSNANVLQGYFNGQGYLPQTVVSGAAVDAGIIMFRGTDKDDNTAMLLLQGTYTGEGTQKNLTPNALVLYYINDAKKPDVFKIETGKF
ncbi:hypothetical protein [Rhizobium sp. RU36D]|uniref:hypothetical protein n=1 Tax=Rhizobium sp. RU36D TaxID=1907415 RepID=UPI0009D8E2C6|nr:hypothetical protein [Rhizobium sp. RU36D]SMC73658.1 hypothetical protein SAMN05880593_105240 [Rhizobium sp. RU36D]